MPKMVDAARVVAMARAGCPVAVIAERLNCHPDTVRSVMAESGEVFETNPAIGTDAESELMAARHAGGASFREIGYEHGWSHTAVSKKVNAYLRRSAQPVTAIVSMQGDELAPVDETKRARAVRRHQMRKMGELQDAAMLYLIRRDEDYKELEFSSMTAYCEAEGIPKATMSDKTTAMEPIDRWLRENGRGGIEEIFTGQFEVDLLKVAGLGTLYRLKGAPEQMHQLLASGSMTTSDGSEASAEEVARMTGSELEEELDRLRKKDRLASEHIRSVHAKAELLDSEKKALQKENEELRERADQLEDRVVETEPTLDPRVIGARAGKISSLLTEVSSLLDLLPDPDDVPDSAWEQMSRTMGQLANVVGNQRLRYGDLFEWK